MVSSDRATASANTSKEVIRWVLRRPLLFAKAISIEEAVSPAFTEVMRSSAEASSTRAISILTACSGSSDVKAASYRPSMEVEEVGDGRSLKSGSGTPALAWDMASSAILSMSPLSWLVQ